MRQILLGLCFLAVLNATGARAAVLSEVVLPAPVGGVTLISLASPEEAAALDVGVVIFDSGIPPDASTHSELGVFPKIREAESRFQSVLLRQALVSSNAWGAVRVMPKRSTLPEVVVEARIIESTGIRLALQISVTDAMGSAWLDRVYVDEAQAGDYPVTIDSDPYADLYRRVANDMLAYRQSLPAAQLVEIRRVAFLRYAQGLSPDSYVGYLTQADKAAGGAIPNADLYRVLRLPAQNDPMVQRVQRIRNQEYLFIDNVDEQYLSLSVELAPTYNLWRQYGREQAIYLAEYQSRVAKRERQGSRGSFVAMQQAYNAYRSLKIQKQDLDELALGFNNEVEPTSLEMSGKVFRLTGTLESQYNEWRTILGSLFLLETGLPIASEGYASPNE